MNLVLSGVIPDELRDAVIETTRPSQVERLHTRAERLVDIECGDGTRDLVATLCGAETVDHAFLDDKIFPNQIKLLVMDMDSTLITVECIDEIASLAGRKSEIAAITEAAMRGEFESFSESLRRRVRLLKGLPLEALQEVYETKVRYSAGAENLLAFAKQNGARTLLLSGGFTYFTDRLKSDLAFDDAKANSLLAYNGRLTGEVAEPIFDDKGKLQKVMEFAEDARISVDSIMAIGDGANDIPMLQYVGHSVAYHAKPKTVLSARYAIKFGTLEVVKDYFEQTGSTPTH